MNVVINVVIALFTALNHHRHYQYQNNVELGKYLLIITKL